MVPDRERGSSRHVRFCFKDKRPAPLASGEGQADLTSKNRYSATRSQ